MIDEETVADTVLSPDSHDNGINVESQYSKPMRIEEPPPMKPLPPGWEKHQGLFSSVFVWWWVSFLCFLIDFHSIQYRIIVDAGLKLLLFGISLFLKSLGGGGGKRTNRKVGI